MKKTYYKIILILCLTVCCMQTYATQITIQVNSNFFSPSTVNVFVGDTIHFVWMSGSHTTTCDGTTGSFLPAGAAPWNSPMNSSVPVFDYPVTVVGAYHYVCLPHAPTMAGNINATLPPSPSINITFSVDLSQQTICGGGPHIAGSFNGWSGTANPLTSVGGGIYETTILLDSNQTYEYKFLLDSMLGSPCGDETIPVACNVNGNRQVIVPPYDSVLATVCFGSCTACVIPPDSVNVTFSVDLSQDTICAGSPHIAGSFNGWSATATPLDSMGNGIYQKTLLLAVDTVYEYKFLNDSVLGSPCGDETVPAACNVNGNRQIIVPVNDTILPLVCFGSCSACAPLIGVSFRVDMSTTTIGPGGPHIAGSFNGFDPAANPLVLIGSIYRKKIFIPAGDTVQYLFLSDSTFTGQEIVPSACGVPDGSGGFYRQVVVPSADTLLDIVCYSSCTVCVTPKVNVIFNVDMSQTLLGPGGPHYAGTYNGFFANVTPMIHIGNNIYSVTLPLDTGHYEEYTFLKDSTYNGQEIISSACGVPNGTGGFNRFVTTQQTNMILPPFCYGSCSVCTVGMNDHDDADIISVYPNPAENILYVETAAAHNNLQLKLLSMDGKLLFSKQVNEGNGENIAIDLGNFAKGIYMLKTESSKGTSVHKVILK